MKAGYNCDVDKPYNAENESSTIEYDTPINDESGVHPNRYRCDSCKHVLDMIDSSEDVNVHFSYFYDTSKEEMRSTYELGESVDDTDVVYWCPYCYTVITHEYAIADAIICGYDIDLSGVHVVEEVKKGEIDG